MNRTVQRGLWTSLWLAVLMDSRSALAQLTTEVIQLSAGWNAIWLNTDPEPSQLDLILAQQIPALDYKTIWTFEASIPPSAATTMDAQGQWFFHDRDVPPIVNTLSNLSGGRGYLIRMNAPGQLTLSGRPVVRTWQFTSRTSNLFGTLTDLKSTVQLSFEKYFSHPNTQGKIRTSGAPPRHEIYKLDGDVLVRRSLSDLIEENVSYWINVVQDFETRGPIDVRATVDGFHFGLTTLRQTINVEVPSSNVARELTLQALPCGFAEGPMCTPPVGGIEWIEYRDPSVSGKLAWKPLSQGATLTVPEGQSTLKLDIRARRANATRRGAKGDPSTLTAFLEVLDGQGARVLLAADVEVQPIFGSWVGRATVTQVGTHPEVQNVPLELAEAEPFGMTLILELPNPTGRRGPSGPRLLDSIEFPIQRDGRSIMQRFNAILFDRPIDLVEDGADPLDPLGTTGTLRGEVFISAEDPLNPYRHRSHPEHRLGYDITRSITLKIERQGNSLADEFAGLDGTFGPNVLTGLYSEVITGVSRDPITVQGSFRLSRLVSEGNQVLR